MRQGISAAVIEYGRVLVVRKRSTWILPGGKPHPDESDETCLRREVEEELAGTQINNIRYYREFNGKTSHTGEMLTERVYFADVNGRVKGISGEINSIAWTKGTEDYNISDITRKIIDSLAEDRLIGEI